VLKNGSVPITSPQGREHRVEVAFGDGVKDMELQSKRAGRDMRCLDRVSARGAVGFMSMAATVAVGASSWSNSNRFATKSAFSKLTPVRLPPGRLRLDQPERDWIAPHLENNGYSRGRRFGRECRRSSDRDNYCHL
jgi:hypothetical protein